MFQRQDNPQQHILDDSTIEDPYVMNHVLFSKMNSRMIRYIGTSNNVNVFFWQVVVILVALKVLPMVATFKHDFRHLSRRVKYLLDIKPALT